MTVTVPDLRQSSQTRLLLPFFGRLGRSLQILTQIVRISPTYKRSTHVLHADTTFDGVHSKSLYLFQSRWAPSCEERSANERIRVLIERYNGS